MLNFGTSNMNLSSPNSFVYIFFLFEIILKMKSRAATIFFLTILNKNYIMKAVVKCTFMLNSIYTFLYLKVQQKEHMECI